MEGRAKCVGLGLGGKVLWARQPGAVGNESRLLTAYVDLGKIHVSLCLSCCILKNGMINSAWYGVFCSVLRMFNKRI